VNLAVLYGLIAMLGMGLSTTLVRVPIRRMGVRRTIVWRNFIEMPLLIALLIFFPFFLDLKIIGVALLLSILGYLPLAAFYKAVDVGKIGVVAPIGSSGIVFASFVSVLLFKESLTVLQVAAILVIVSGIVLLSINFKDWKNSDLFQVSEPEGTNCCPLRDFHAKLSQRP